MRLSMTRQLCFVDFADVCLGPCAIGRDDEKWLKCYPRSPVPLSKTGRRIVNGREACVFRGGIDANEEMYKHMVAVKWSPGPER